MTAPIVPLTLNTKISVNNEWKWNGQVPTSDKSDPKRQFFAIAAHLVRLAPASNTLKRNQSVIFVKSRVFYLRKRARNGLVGLLLFTITEESMLGDFGALYTRV